MKGIFITGTDTGVGKTVAAAALMCRYRSQASLRYWKPIQTGVEVDDDTVTVRNLADCTEAEIFAQGIRLPKPVSPHLAARWARTRIDLAALAALRDDDNAAWIVEGAGGLLVPVNESETMADWIGMLGLPVVVVARSGLGTINHTLLTLEALRSRRLRVAGVLMNGEPNADNRAAIEHYGHAPVIGELPVMEPLSHLSLTACAPRLDPSSSLLEFLR
jgi:dethiobiotin synthetase